MRERARWNSVLFSMFHILISSHILDAWYRTLFSQVSQRDVKDVVLKRESWLFLNSLILFIGVSVPKTIILSLTAYVTQSNKYEQEQTKVLAGYLSKLKFTEADGIHLPDETLPQGFLFNYKRCSHRTMYVPRDGFTLIVSEESIWSSDDRGEQNREIVRRKLIRLFVIPFMGT